jgi:hypothetical protein
MRNSKRKKQKQKGTYTREMDKELKKGNKRSQRNVQLKNSKL